MGVRERNSATCTGAASGCSALVSVDKDSGLLTRIAQNAHQTLAATGDLSAIDATRGVYYFLGDSWNGTQGTLLVALSLKTGAELCRRQMPVGEVGIVGGGQSLSLDTKHDRLLISGLTSQDNGTTYHHLLHQHPRLKRTRSRHRQPFSQRVV